MEGARRTHRARPGLKPMFRQYTGRQICYAIACAAFFLAVMIALTVDLADKARGADVVQTPAPAKLFVSMAVFYKGGQFVGAKVVGLPFDSQHECMGALQHAIGAMQQNGSIPAEGAVIGACIPVPEKAPAGAAAALDKEAPSHKVPMAHDGVSTL